jgi:hypothetical protein
MRPEALVVLAQKGTTSSSNPEPVGNGCVWVVPVARGSGSVLHEGYHKPVFGRAPLAVTPLEGCDLPGQMWDLLLSSALTGTGWRLFDPGLAEAALAGPRVTPPDGGSSDGLSFRAPARRASEGTSAPEPAAPARADSQEAAAVANQPTREPVRFPPPAGLTSAELDAAARFSDQQDPPLANPLQPALPDAPRGAASAGGGGGAPGASATGGGGGTGNSATDPASAAEAAAAARAAAQTNAGGQTAASEGQRHSHPAPANPRGAVHLGAAAAAGTPLTPAADPTPAAAPAATATPTQAQSASEGTSTRSARAGTTQARSASAGTTQARSASAGTGKGLTPIDPTVNATEGAGNSPGPVASFTDADGNTDPTKYTATINWGDGQSSPAAGISYDPVSQTFSVYGSHTYAEEGSFSITTSITDSDGSSTTVTSPAFVILPHRVGRAGRLADRFEPHRVGRAGRLADRFVSLGAVRIHSKRNSGDELFCPNCLWINQLWKFISTPPHTPLPGGGLRSPPDKS